MPLLLAALFVSLWASGYVVGAIGLAVSDPFALLAVRFVLASLVVVPLALRTPGWRRAPWRRLVGVGFALQVMQFGFGYTGMKHGVHPALAALIMLGLSPLISTAGAVALAMEPSRPVVWVALLVGVGGVVISLAPALTDAHVGVGLVLVLLAALGLAAGGLAQKRWGGSVDPRVSVGVQSLTGAAVFVPLALLTGETDVELGSRFALAVGWLAWAGTAGAFVLQAMLLKRMPISAVSALLMLVPLVTAALAFALLGQRLDALSFAGMPITMAAVALVQRRATPLRVTVRRDEPGPAAAEGAR